MQERLIDFLQEELSIPTDRISLALRQAQSMPNQLPMMLWQYGLISLGQLERIFDWLETV